MENNNIQTAINTALQIGKAFDINGVPAVLVPEGCEVQLFEEIYPIPEKTPPQLKESISVEDAKSFIAYYNRFASESSTIFVDTVRGKFVAVIDYHQDHENTQHGQHLLTYTTPKTTEWSIWAEHNGRSNAKEQEEFALFIEQNLDEIRKPAAAEMLEITLSLRANTKLNFKKSVHLGNGQNQLTYVENIDGTAGAQGQLEIPDEITLGLSPFKGGDAYEVKAKFRYRINNGNLVMWYDLIRPTKVYEAALKDITEKIESDIEKGMLINGIR